MDPVSGLVTVGAGIVNNTMEMANQQINARYQRQFAEEEYKRNLEQWNRENEYNLPINQMARLKQAGLNPRMIYGSSGATVQSAQSPQMQMKAPEAHAKDLVDPSMILTMSQAKVLEQQAEGLRIENLEKLRDYEWSQTMDELDIPGLRFDRGTRYEISKGIGFQSDYTAKGKSIIKDRGDADLELFKAQWGTEGKDDLPYNIKKYKLEYSQLKSQSDIAAVDATLSALRAELEKGNLNVLLNINDTLRALSPAAAAVVKLAIPIFVSLILKK